MIQEYDCYVCNYSRNSVTEADITIDSAVKGEDIRDAGEDFFAINTDKGADLLRQAQCQLQIREAQNIPADKPLTLKVERNIFIRELENEEDAITLLKKMLAKRVVF